MATELQQAELEASFAALRWGLGIVGTLLTLLLGVSAAYWRSFLKRLDEIVDDVRDATKASIANTATLQVHEARISANETESVRMREKQHDQASMISGLSASVAALNRRQG